MFHCGCSALALTAHCNIHAPAPPHCPWCAHPAWFALSALLALAFALTALALMWRRRTTAIVPSLVVGVVALVAGGTLGALITRLAID